ncbi:peptide deformylase [Lactiplantibacillus modestisalitolerans]|uniref:Peptide deformylase n=1 Tax=Lactiplantibacillus modestisalitolerans TaxID=1457219 RepID=A0ABV5WSH1_9LACO|nr:peptide deformylase [Lactiplantibacillus modestisalitolerans]
MIKPVVHDPAALTTVAAPATRADAQVITDLRDTLAAHQAACVGMAANMIGVNKRIIIIQVGPLAIPLVNPEITHQSGPYQAQEGCLSLTGERSATRYRDIRVRFLDQHFHPQQQAFSGFSAQIVQHELDHCNGILI